MYDRTTVQGATFNMRGQLYRKHANATALFNSPVVSALGSESDDPGSSPGRGKALCPWDVREKNMRAPLLRLAKSIYQFSFYTLLVTTDPRTISPEYHVILPNNIPSQSQ